MSLVILENACIAFADRPILESASLRIAAGDRIGLIGPNGSGKSTLLRVLAGDAQLDSGAVERSRGTRVGALSQDIDHTSGTSALGLCLASAKSLATVDSELSAAQSALAAAADREDHDACMRLSADVAELSEKLAIIERDFGEHEALRILAGLGFSTTEAHRDLGELSGGWQMRAHLAALLFQRPDLLLLDEPTNHLDMPSVAWFTDFLRTCQSAYVLVSHDREFLNDHIGRVVSFEPEGLRSYPGNLDRYQRQRAEEAAVLEARAQNLAREREHMERFVSRFRAQANKASAVQSRVKALAKMEDITKLTGHKHIHLTFSPAGRAPAEVARGEGIAKSFGEKSVLTGIDLVIRRGEKIAILGPNGAGKTTLLKIVAGELAADGGTVRTSRDITLGYYAQHHADTLAPDATVQGAVTQHAPDTPPSRVRSILGALLFHGDDVEKPIKVLSGGERARVALARLIAAPANFLVMDEPTNHLDLGSADSLATSLAEWDGTLLFVSHNLALVRKVATQIWSLDSGVLEIYGGTLDDYLYSRRLRASAQNGEPAAATTPQAKKPAPAAERRDDDRARKRREAENRNRRAQKLRPIHSRIADIEARIAKLESEQAERSHKLSDPDIYADTGQRSQLFGAYQKAAAKLEELLARWETASEELSVAEKSLDDA